VFREPEMPARIARLRELGMPLSGVGPHAVAGPGGARLESPDGTPLMLLQSER
jgi:hypothetical protein